MTQIDYTRAAKYFLLQDFWVVFVSFAAKFEWFWGTFARWGG